VQMHTIEPELLGVRPRSARWTDRTVAVRRLLWNLMFGTVLILFFFGRNDLTTWDALIARGVPTVASVWEKDVSHGKHTSYYLRYTFTTDELLCYGTQSVSRSEYESARIGDTFSVTYLPGSNGEKWQLGTATRQRRDARSGQWLFAGFIAVASFGFAIALFESEMRGQRRLLRTGLVTVGRVVSGKITTHKSSKTYSIDYEFMTDKTVACTRSVTVSQPEYERYTPNDPYLTVVYDENDCNRSKPYFRLTAAELAGR
ncbi:MAG: hypothetical protein H7145_08810, partial [Akkermansiaceae bacterium]|nr:hypothetical protein [Armatimonadota bacterium]